MIEQALVGQKEVEQLVIYDWRRQQRDIDLYKRIKYEHNYKDREQGKEPKYSLEDDAEMASKSEEEAFRDEERIKEYEEDEDVEIEKERGLRR